MHTFLPIISLGDLWDSAGDFFLNVKWDASWVAIGISALALTTSLFALRASYGQYLVAKRKWLSDEFYKLSEQARLVSIKSKTNELDNGEWEAEIDIYNSSNAPIFPLGFVMVFHKGPFFVKHFGMSMSCDISKTFPEMKLVASYTHDLYTLSSPLSFNDEIKFREYKWDPLSPGKFKCKVQFTEKAYPFPFRRRSGWVFDDMDGNTWTRRFDGKLFEGIGLGDGDSLR
ncbi:hypothetical protein [Kocuria rosea]|uniref:hypothetical protein n=1 Tax=Kocuria rosea TaxID=1275 RepID=UPI0011C01E88|nr:hypothetical protein [Kocuria rosea]